MSDIKKIPIKEFVKDIRTNITVDKLLEKYELSIPGLIGSFDKLIQISAIVPEELKTRFALYPQTIELVEERGHCRTPVIELILACDIEDVKAEGRVINISKTGLQVEGITAKPGQIRNLLIMLEGFAAFSPFSIRAECRWTRSEPKTHSVLSGFKIIGISDDAESELCKLLQSLKVLSKGERFGIVENADDQVLFDEDEMFVETQELQNLAFENLSSSGSFVIPLPPAPFGHVLSCLPIPTLLLNSEQGIMELNESCKMIGLHREDCLGSKFWSFFPDVAQRVKLLLNEVSRKRNIINFVAMLAISQKRIPAKIGVRSIRCADQKMLMITVQDLGREMHALTARKLKMEQLQKSYREVIGRLAANEATMAESRELLENVMRTLEDRIREEKEKISMGIRFHLKPIIDRLKQEKLSENGLSLINVLEHLFDEILNISRFRVSRLYGTLSLRETEICDLILAGYGTKAIADALGVSLDTIATHRSRIRKKLSISSDQNLYNFLRSYIESPPRLGR